MSEDRYSGLIDSLVSDLQPVRRLPRLRVAMAMVLGVWIGVSTIIFAAKLASGPSALDRFLGAWSFGVVVAGLVLSALGGVLAGLASGVPGREVAERTGRRVGLTGLGLALLVALHATVTTAVSVSVPLQMDGVCFSTAVMVALLPGGVLVGFMHMGWVQRPLRSAAIALVGAFALGALAIHLVCPIPGPRHMLVGHVGVPPIMSLLCLLPLGLLLKRFAR